MASGTTWHVLHRGAVRVTGLAMRQILTWSRAACLCTGCAIDILNARWMSLLAWHYIADTLTCGRVTRLVTRPTHAGTCVLVLDVQSRIGCPVRRSSRIWDVTLHYIAETFCLCLPLLVKRELNTPTFSHMNGKTFFAGFLNVVYTVHEPLYSLFVLTIGSVIGCLYTSMGLLVNWIEAWFGNEQLTIPPPIACHCLYMSNWLMIER